jgi:catechol 2,3-dioxygenase-like lactoylglutathione lyase family enzyme
MIDHLGLIVTSLDRSRAFYDAALAPLGYGLVESHEGALAFGPPGMPLFWVYEGSPAHRAVHVAFSAADRDSVDCFHIAALGAGATDNGAPGLRPEYHDHYYGAFVLDPDGNNVEAVCHAPA